MGAKRTTKKAGPKKPAKKKVVATRPFTSIEDYYLQGNAGKFGLADLATNLGRTEQEVGARLIELKLDHSALTTQEKLAHLQPKPGVTNMTMAHSKAADDIAKTADSGGAQFLKRYENCIAPAFPAK